MFIRSDQEDFLKGYRQGYVGLTATPGAGKTTLLVRLIGQLLAQGIPIERILVLSYTKAASLNFRERLLQKYPQLQGQNLSNICTIHSCAYRLIRPHLRRWGYQDRPLTPIIPLQKKALLEELTYTWLEGKEDLWQKFLVSGHTTETIRLWRSKLVELAEEGVSLAKQQQLYPLDVRRLTEAYPERFFLKLTSAVYAPYQQQLNESNLLDFDDMVNLAIRLLSEDQTVREYWQTYYQYLLEDEAQDSTQAQHHLLQLLAGAEGNWIRVGDPNQAIFSSFTAADPRFLVDFCHQHAHASLTQAGRSVEPIILTANWFLNHVVKHHPHPTARSAFFEQLIKSTPDAPKPTAHSQPRFLVAPDRGEEVRSVLERAQRYLKHYPEHSVGVLAFSHRSLDEMAEQLTRWQLEFVDRRQGQAGEFLKRLVILLNWLYDPAHPTQDLWLHLGEFTNKATVLGLCHQLDLVAWLDGEAPWVQLRGWAKLGAADQVAFSDLATRLRQFYQQRSQPLAQVWLQGARLLADSPQALATAEMLAENLLAQAQTLPQLVALLKRQKGRENLVRWSPTAGDDAEEVKGKVELCTLHSAKGREWDAVLLTGITDYWFPTDHEGTFQGQLDYVTIYPQAQLKSEFNSGRTTVDFTEQLKDDIITERLRLLYVGLTRPRYYLHLSTHGQPAQVFTWLEEALSGGK